MQDIKIKKKQENKTPIKIVDRKAIYKEKLKENFFNVKEKANYDTKENEDNSPSEYGINKITEKTNLYFNRGINNLNRYGKKSVKTTKQNIQKASKKIKQKIENKTIKTAKNKIKTTKETIKNANRTIKTTKQTGKVAYKTTKQTVKTAVKGAKKTYQIAKITAKATIKGIKVGVKATITTLKAIIAGTKALIAFLVAGGWVAALIIIVICLIAFICSSVFGIFFSSENGVGDKTMSAVIREINIDFTNKITDIQKNNEHDDYEIKSNRAEWKDVLSVYSVIVSNGEETTDVITLNDNKINQLKTIFWEMNIINSSVREQEKEIETTDENGNTKIVKVKRKVLYIDIQSRSVEEMIQRYNFNEQQLQQLAELRKDEYNSMWSYVLYGSAIGSNDIVQVALSQVGNIGGQPFWSWYGFESRVEWCACFVSWCANECGYITAGTIPKFSSCQSEGVTWFKTCGLWQERGYTPKPGDIIFFDWEDSNDGKADHVGIVEKYESERVYTIEGNSTGDTCKQKDYDANSSVILGYGTPMY